MRKLGQMLFYVGTYSQRGSKGIYVFTLDKSSGALTPVGTADGVTNPSFVALHPNGKFLYSACETESGPGHTGSVASFALDPATGIPSLLNQQSSQGGGPCFVGVDHKGRNVFVANYGSGSVAALPIGADGKLHPATAAIQHKDASHANPQRQEGPHAHSINADPSDRFVIAADLGCDKLFVYRLDAARGTLTPNDPPFTATKPGAGPRHLAFHPNGRLAFVTDEMVSTVTSYRYDGARGVLTEVQTISMLPEGYNTPGNTAAEVRVHPSGKFVYASNRGHNSIAAFAVDAATGKLRSLGQFPSGGKIPRGFEVDPTGAFLIAAHQDSDNLVVHRIDTKTGRLTPTGHTAAVPAGVCVRFAPVS